MIGALLETRISTSNPFAEKWDSLVDYITDAFKLTYEESLDLKGSKIARLIGATPYIADCKDPKRTALTNLTSYLLTKRTYGIFDYKPTDNMDLHKRLSIFDIFIDGDKEVIEKSMNLLALNMLCEYNRTLEEDFELCKYNPILSGALDFEAERETLIKQVETTECTYIDEILTTFEAQILWW